jgi:hypothetical protein
MIQHTNNYDQFKQVTSNREVNQKHVKKLARAVQAKNLLHVNPIIVNDKMEIIDGQHRLEAARLLKVPIFYVVDESITKQDISALNANARNWMLMDYINYWTTEKAPGFATLSKYISEYPFLKPSTIISLLSGRENGGLAGEYIQQGKVFITNESGAIEIISLLQKIGNYNMVAFETKFVTAILKLSQHEEWDSDRMIRQVDKQPRSLVKCANVKQYIEMLLEIYNYQQQKRIRM